MLKFTVNELLNIKNSLGRLSQKDLPTLISFSLSKFMLRVDVIIGQFQEDRTTLIKTANGDKPRGPEDPVIPVERQAEFEEKVKGLLSEVHEFGLEPISIRSLGQVAVKPMDLVVLQDIIVE